MHDWPYYPFYARDWVASSTRAMSLSARGVYCDLLAFAWLEDGLDSDPERLRRTVGATPREWGEIWPDLDDKFPVAGDGRRRNERQETERQKLQTVRDARTRGGRARADGAARRRGRLTSSAPACAGAEQPADHQQDRQQRDQHEHQQGHQHSDQLPPAITRVQSTDQDQDPGLRPEHLPVETVEKSRRKAVEPPRPEVIARLVLDLLEAHADDVEPYRDADLKEDLKRACARHGLAYHADAVRKALDAAEAQWHRRKRPA